MSHVGFHDGRHVSLPGVQGVAGGAGGGAGGGGPHEAVSVGLQAAGVFQNTL